MNTKKEQLEFQRSKTAARLKECLEMRSLKQSDLLHRTELRHSIKMTRAQLSQICNGSRTLQLDFARAFADILNIDVGYLLGLDDYRAESYSDYDDFYGIEYQKEREELEKYDHLLNMAGYTVTGMTVVDDQVKDYTIKRRGKTACVPVEDMERFSEDVAKYIKKLLDPIMDLYREEV